MGRAAALHRLTLHEARRLLDRREISAAELTDDVLGRIAEVEPQVEAFVTVTADLAREQARRADAILSKGEGHSLTGIPMQVKDVICTRGVRTTCASRMLEAFVPPYDATVVERLNAQSPVLVGKGNMDEFAMGSSTENSAFHPTRNPWDLERVPGGSSGGAAAAVAASECLFALGSDTGGSIRQPAALCGVTGLKPTYGLVSRFGLVAFASSLDQIGPLAKDAQDCALVLNAIAGHDPRDSTSIPGDRPDYVRGLHGGVKGLRLGVPREYFGEGVDPEVGGSRAGGGKGAGGGRGGGGGVLAAPHALRPGSLLHHRPFGVLGEPGPLRRREVRLLRPRGGLDVGGAGGDARAGLRARGEATHPAGHLRSLRRLLRRVLPEGAQGAHAHPAGDGSTPSKATTPS